MALPFSGAAPVDSSVCEAPRGRSLAESCAERRRRPRADEPSCVGRRDGARARRGPGPGERTCRWLRDETAPRLHTSRRRSIRPVRFSLNRRWACTDRFLPGYLATRTAGPDQRLQRDCHPEERADAEASGWQAPGPAQPEELHQGALQLGRANLRPMRRDTEHQRDGQASGDPQPDPKKNTDSGCLPLSEPSSRPKRYEQPLFGVKFPRCAFAPRGRVRYVSAPGAAPLGAILSGTTASGGASWPTKP